MNDPIGMDPLSLCSFTNNSCSTGTARDPYSVWMPFWNFERELLYRNVAVVDDRSE